MDSNNNSRIPKLRFPGFEGEWEEKTLGQVFTRLTSKNIENNQNVLTISAQYGLISQLDFFKKSVAAADVTGYYLLHKGDFAYNKSSSQGHPVGAIKPLKLYDKGVVSTLYICFKCKNPREIDFWEQYFDAGILDNGIMSIAQEGARNHGLLNISTVEFFSLPVLTPSFAEQQKIAECLSALDDQIASQQQKVETLKDHKKGLMQQLFPQQGKTTPRLRFPGFEGEWEEKKLGDCLEISTERNLDNRYGKEDVLSVSDEEGVVNQITLLGRSYAGKAVNNYKILKKNQIVYTKSPLKAKPFGIVKVNRGDAGIVSVLYAVYDAKEGVCPDYIHYFFDPCYRINNYLQPLVNKGAKNTMNISDEMALQGTISIPSYAEQQKIAECLSSMDDLINLEEQKLETLKDHKKGLMQQLFPQPAK